MCKGGEFALGKTTVTVQRGETLVIIKDVPADVCRDCGEAYLDDNVAQKIEQQVEEAVARHTEIAILRYAA
jgi:YgiT-type zinc finger domain-containing protein